MDERRQEALSGRFVLVLCCGAAGEFSSPLHDTTTATSSKRRRRGLFLSLAVDQRITPLLTAGRSLRGTQKQFRERVRNPSRGLDDEIDVQMDTCDSRAKAQRFERKNGVDLGAGGLRTGRLAFSTIKPERANAFDVLKGVVRQASDHPAEVGTAVGLTGLTGLTSLASRVPRLAGFVLPGIGEGLS